MEYVDENKHLINGAFDSMGYEEIKRFFYNDLFSVLDGAISQGETELGVRLDPGFKKYLATFYTEASAGLLMEWIKSRDAYDKRDSFRKPLVYFQNFHDGNNIPKGLFRKVKQPTIKDLREPGFFRRKLHCDTTCRGWDKEKRPTMRTAAFRRT